MASGALRRGLDALYDGAAWLAALFMVGLLVMVLLSIAGRQFHFNLPGTDAYAGYMMAAAGFLALAHTFKRNEHIRVTLVLSSLHGAPRRALEIWALVALVFATAVLGSELEDGTAVYLLVKPIERWRIVVAKLAVAVGSTVALVFPATLLSGLVVGGGRGGELVAVGYSLAVLPGSFVYAAGFLALAHTFKRNEHIRVTLLLSSLHGSTRRAMEVWALAAAALLAALAAWYSCRLCWQSYTFRDISTGNDATPLWLPQLSMAIGSVVLAIAILDELVLELRGRRVLARADEATRNE